MSIKELRDDEIWQTRMRVFERDEWRCVGRLSDGSRCCRQATQLAHVLPQDKLHIALYGEEVIHHDDNLRGTCPDHNAQVQINFRSRPAEANEHANRIRQKLQEGS
jgi:hypothetical protein